MDDDDVSANDDDSAPLDDDDSAPVDDDDDSTAPDDDDSAPPPPTCADDALEDSDTLLDAAPLKTGTTNGLVACPGDPDWVFVETDGEGGFTMTASFDPGGGAIVMEHMAEDGTVLDTAQVVGRVIGFYIPAEAGVRHWIRITGVSRDPNVGPTYSLTLAPGGAPCVPDGHEENDDAASASPLDPEFVVATVCPGDDDWYAIDLVEDDLLQLRGYFAAAEGEIAMAVQDPDGATTALTPTGTGSTLDFVAGTAGTHLVHVSLGNDPGLQDGNPYEIDVDVWSAACQPDAMEPNEWSGGAAVAPLGPSTGWTFCPGDFDWWAVTVPAGATLTVDVLFSQAEGDIDILLFDAPGSWVAESTSSTDNESVSATTGSGATFLIEFFLVADPGDPGLSYSLDVNIQ